ncbi:type VII secretion target [Mycobacterium sp. IS-1496]|uniref:type VII secretion target n=1 Tax=Mycobacterium sp. IS-1496 TaxID=1772284 RepID=UPI000A64467B|nr:type VII secretion target [Mycobacterium sp. IS-1496]
MSGNVQVETAAVRLSAAQMHVVAEEASSSRAAVAGSISGQESAWKTAGKPGFSAFIDILEAQATRLHTDLTDLGDKLRAAADVYDQQDALGGAALDGSVRYR